MNKTYKENTGFTACSCGQAVQYLTKDSMYLQTCLNRLESPVSAWLFLSFCQHVKLVHVFVFCSKKGGASRSRVSAVAACKAQRTAGSPAPAVLQPDAMPVGLDSEADRCHLKRNQTTCRGTDGAVGQREGPSDWFVWITEDIKSTVLSVTCTMTI